MLQLKIQLEAAGFQVISAESLGQAEELLKEGRPDCAIVDLMMEHMDAGFTLSYHIKKIDPSIPVIMVTAVTRETGIDFDKTEDNNDSWLKADVVLAKPIRFEQLQHEIKRLLKG